MIARGRVHTVEEMIRQVILADLHIDCGNDVNRIMVNFQRDHTVEIRQMIGVFVRTGSRNCLAHENHRIVLTHRGVNYLVIHRCDREIQHVNRVTFPQIGSGLANGVNTARHQSAVVVHVGDVIAGDRNRFGDKIVGDHRQIQRDVCAVATALGFQRSGVVT